MIIVKDIILWWKSYRAKVHKEQVQEGLDYAVNYIIEKGTVQGLKDLEDAVQRAKDFNSFEPFDEGIEKWVRHIRKDNGTG